MSVHTLPTAQPEAPDSVGHLTSCLMLLEQNLSLTAKGTIGPDQARQLKLRLSEASFAIDSKTRGESAKVIAYLQPLDREPFRLLAKLLNPHDFTLVSRCAGISTTVNFRRDRRRLFARVWLSAGYAIVIHAYNSRHIIVAEGMYSQALRVYRDVWARMFKLALAGCLLHHDDALGHLEAIARLMESLPITYSVA